MHSDQHRNRITTAALRCELRCRDAVSSVSARLRDERGASMVEYGLLLTTALIIAFVVVQLFGQRVLGLFEAVEAEWRNIGGAGGGGSST